MSSNNSDMDLSSQTNTNNLRFAPGGVVIEGHQVPRQQINEQQYNEEMMQFVNNNNNGKNYELKIIFQMIETCDMLGLDNVYTQLNKMVQHGVNNDFTDDDFSTFLNSSEARKYLQNTEETILNANANNNNNNNDNNNEQEHKQDEKASQQSLMDKMDNLAVHNNRQPFAISTINIQHDKTVKKAHSFLVEWTIKNTGASEITENNTVLSSWVNNMYTSFKYYIPNIKSGQQGTIQITVISTTKGRNNISYQLVINNIPIEPPLVSSFNVIENTNIDNNNNNENGNGNVNVNGNGNGNVNVNGNGNGNVNVNGNGNVNAIENVNANANNDIDDNDDNNDNNDNNNINGNNNGG
eukprot:372269_1